MSKSLNRPNCIHGHGVMMVVQEDRSRGPKAEYPQAFKLTEKIPFGGWPRTTPAELLVNVFECHCGYLEMRRAQA